MKLAVKVATPLVAVLAAATTVVAVADPVPAKDPYPNVAAKADVCLDEKLEVKKQQTQYDFQLRKYERAKKLAQDGGGSAEDARKAERELHEVALKLNAAKYKEAACRNREGNDPKKDCIALVLELHQLIDELPIRKALEDLAWKDYNAIKDLVGVSITPELKDQLETAAKVATIEREQIEQRTKDKRKAIDANPACKGFPVDRPEQKNPAPPNPEQPTSTTSIPEEPPTATSSPSESSTVAPTSPTNPE